MITNTKNGMFLLMMKVDSKTLSTQTSMMKKSSNLLSVQNTLATLSSPQLNLTRMKWALL
jgi:hypothetical protein